MFKQIDLKDARPYVKNLSQNADQNLLFMTDFTGVDFTNKTLQLGFSLVCYCERGTATAKLNDRTVTLRPGQVLVGFGNQIIEEATPSPDFSGHIALISLEYSLESFVGLQHLWPFLLHIYQNPVLTLNEEEKKWLFDSFELMRKRLADESHHYHKETVVTMLRLIYLDVCNFLIQRQNYSKEITSRGYILFDRFIMMARENIRKHHHVQWYSEQLYITPKYLSESIKKVSGRTAGQWLNILILSEIKLLLRDTTLNVKEIAHEMNFPSQGSLGKYFKNFTGMSPSDYRNA